MIYEFDSEELIKRFEDFPDIEKLVKLVEQVRLKNGSDAQIQIIITVNENDFVGKHGKTFIGNEN